MGARDGSLLRFLFRQLACSGCRLGHVFCGETLGGVFSLLRLGCCALARSELRSLLGLRARLRLLQRFRLNRSTPLRFGCQIQISGCAFTSGFISQRLRFSARECKRCECAFRPFAFACEFLRILLCGRAGQCDSLSCLLSGDTPCCGFQFGCFCVRERLGLGLRLTFGGLARACEFECFVICLRAQAGG
jgi:hypothetical protein